MIDAHLHLGNLKGQGAALAALRGKIFVSSALSVEEGAKELALCEEAGGYCSIGEHPWFAKSEKLDEALLKSYLNNPRFKAVGECGLDKKSPLPLEEQLKLLEAHAIFALEHSLPLVLHLTAYRQEALALLKNFPGLKMMVHYVSGSYEILGSYLKAGAYLSFCAASPLSKAQLKILSEMDLCKLLVESDFDAAQERRGAYSYEQVDNLTKTIAKLRGLDVKTLTDRLDDNLTALLGL